MAAAEADRADRGDYLSSWVAGALDERPVIFVAVVMEEQTLTWLMSPDDDDALHAGVSRLSADAQVTMRGKTLFDVSQSVSWLVKEATGMHLHESRAFNTGN